MPRRRPFFPRLPRQRRARPMPARAAASWSNLRPVHRIARPYTLPIQDYTQEVTIPLVNGVASVTFPASGTGTAQVGPQGLGTVWHATMAAISTTTGANDTSTATVFAGAAGVATLVAAQSYAGGGDTAGLNDVDMEPGDVVVCTWTGATSGATGTLVVYGTETRLTLG